MTKTDFGKQFQRLRVAGYRLPVFDGVKVTEVIDEWYATFGGCSLEEFSAAIDRLKQQKTDTWWPATGEIWSHIFEIRKARRIRNSVNESHEWPETGPNLRQQLAADFREFARKLSQQMTMPHAEPQVPPQHVTEDEEERARLAAEETA